MSACFCCGVGVFFIFVLFFPYAWFGAEGASFSRDTMSLSQRRRKGNDELMCM